MKHIKMISLSKRDERWLAKLECTHWLFWKNNIIVAGKLFEDGEVMTSGCSIISDKPIDAELVKNAIFQQWRVFG